MFLLDDILLSPVRGLFWIFREIHAAAEAAQTSEKEDITTRLSELYMELETGRIDEAEFDKREKTLLDRLDHLEEGGDADSEGKSPAGDDDDSDEESPAGDDDDSDEESPAGGDGEDDTEGGERE